MPIDANISAAIENRRGQIHGRCATRGCSRNKHNLRGRRFDAASRVGNLVGRSNIQAYWGRGAGIREVRIKPSDIRLLSAGAVREAGLMEIRINMADERLREISCKYVFVWQLTGEDWKLETAIWNRIVDPSKGAGRQAAERVPRAALADGEDRAVAVVGGQDGRAARARTRTRRFGTRAAG